MDDVWGRAVTRLRAPGGARSRTSQWLPMRRKDVVFVCDRRSYFARWQPNAGLLVYGSGPAGSVAPEVYYLDPNERRSLMKRRSVVSPDAAIRPALPHESKVFLRLTALCEFLSATVYDDGTARTPGYFWFSNRGTLYELTLFDPDAGARLPLVAKTIDDAFAAADLTLRAEDAPWQPDKYLTEQLEKRRPKKKGS